MSFFNNTEQVELLKNIETMLTTISSRSEEPEVFSEEEMRQAAYALNLCMVSVSQIVDYDDLYILEQEYDAILNNLNLEMMPKDEALLDILKQLLNTITFFRIQEGDKKFIDHDYQQKMKDAIWSAVPNFATVIAGGSPLSIAVSLAAQVGIGYMNYRRVKAQNELEYEKEMWQLQRSAMEQFNALRRELFDTAWRLADKYNFPDEYRITESQITRYNGILMDSDYLRRYERLECISGKFEAYPPYWYYLGNAANIISKTTAYADEIRAKYQDLAAQHFEKYLAWTERNLLREDKIRASCALEYFDLLIDTGADRAKLNGLVDIALKSAGNAYDVLELCAIAYMRLGDYQNAASTLRMLVNEGYNQTINAQLLSCIYVSNYTANPNVSIKHDYDTLANRVNPGFLFPMPEKPIGLESDTVALQKEFIQRQRSILVEQYTHALGKLSDKYYVKFDEVLPTPYSTKAPDSRKDKCREICEVVASEDGKRAYFDGLSGFQYRMMIPLNEFFAAVQNLPGLQDVEKIGDLIEEELVRESSFLSSFVEKIKNTTLTENDIVIFFRKDFLYFTKSALAEIVHQLCSTIEVYHDMAEFSHAEEKLRVFCKAQNLTLPEIHLIQRHRTDTSAPSLISRFNVDIIYHNNQEKARWEKQRSEMYEAIKRVSDSIVRAPSKQLAFYLNGTEAFRSYYSRHKKDLGDENSILAILNDMSISDEDWLLTMDGLCFYGRGQFVKKIMDAPIPYGDIKTEMNYAYLKPDKRHQIKYKTLDVKCLSDLLTTLHGISSKFRAEANKPTVPAELNLTKWISLQFNHTEMIPPIIIGHGDVLPKFKS